MTTLECIKRSEVLLAPPKYHFSTHVRTTHGSAFSIGRANGTASLPLKTTSANRGIGISVRSSQTQERVRNCRPELTVCNDTVIFPSAYLPSSKPIAFIPLRFAIKLTIFIMGDDEDSTLCEVQRLFGAGIKRKRVDFVPAGTLSTAVPEETNPPTFTGDQYLSLVLKNGSPSKSHSQTDIKVSDGLEGPSQERRGSKGVICEICNLPLQDSDNATTTPHEASIAHQVCLKHSYPPSHLDRERQGLKYLSSYGWDPDSRLGLGATGEGIRVPIKAKVKNNTVGLGVELKEPKDLPQEKVEKLDAKKVRKKELEDRRKGEKLRQIFYGNDDVEKYLGGS